MSDKVFSDRSNKNLVGVHPDLIRLATRALELSAIHFIILEHSVRTLADEEAEVAAHKSETLHSMHIVQPDGFSHAIDVGAFDDSGKYLTAINYYHQIDAAFSQASHELDIPVTWGGDWHFGDADHFELSQKAYGRNGQRITSSEGVTNAE